MTATWTELFKGFPPDGTYPQTPLDALPTDEGDQIWQTDVHSALPQGGLAGDLKALLGTTSAGVTGWITVDTNEHVRIRMGRLLGGAGIYGILFNGTGLFTVELPVSGTTVNVH